MTSKIFGSICTGDFNSAADRHYLFLALNFPGRTEFCYGMVG
jgi:hypothetical protein